jgi:AraC-like DNA-binding protein
MEDYFKYLTHNSLDEDWGLYLTVAGCARVPPGTSYPPPGHPTGYSFNWENGRILHEFQINYVTEGEGILELKSDRFQVKEGSVIIIRPDQWHRYRPLKEKGWKEHYIGFKGQFTRKLLNNHFFSSTLPVIHIGFEERVLQSFHEVINIVRDERPGYHQVCAGLVIHILGLIRSIKKNENFRHGKIENTIQKACIIIRDNLDKNLNVEELADQLNVSYSLFRKAFKRYTGLSPAQYHLSLRLKQANILLTNTDMSIKEISFQLGFCSVYYFSKLFKEKNKVTPTDYRNHSIRSE